MAGMKHSAESMGVGRGYARLPRIKGSGTGCQSNGAFANMARHGRMAFPLQTWRRWHRKINLKLKRHALAIALAATASPALVMARGHKIDNLSSIPLVVTDNLGECEKTK